MPNHSTATRTPTSGRENATPVVVIEGPTIQGEALDQIEANDLENRFVAGIHQGTLTKFDAFAFLAKRVDLGDGEPNWATLADRSGVTKDRLAQFVAAHSPSGADCGLNGEVEHWIAGEDLFFESRERLGWFDAHLFDEVIARASVRPTRLAMSS